MITIVNIARGTLVCDTLQILLEPGVRKELAFDSVDAAKAAHPELAAFEARKHMLLIAPEAQAKVEEVKPPEPVATIEEPVVPVEEPAVAEQPAESADAEPAQKKSKSKSSK